MVVVIAMNVDRRAARRVVRREEFQAVIGNENEIAVILKADHLPGLRVGLARLAAKVRVVVLSASMNLLPPRRAWPRRRSEEVSLVRRLVVVVPGGLLRCNIYNECSCEGDSRKGIDLMGIVEESGKGFGFTAASADLLILSMTMCAARKWCAVLL